VAASFAELLLSEHSKPATQREYADFKDAAACSERKPLGRPIKNLMEVLLADITSQDLDGCLCEALGWCPTSAKPSVARFNFPLISPKALSLLEALLPYRTIAEEEPRWSCIIFVQQRVASMGLAALLQATGCFNRWIRSSPFMGQGSIMGGLAFMPKDQTDILGRFRVGELNLLVSTSGEF